MPIRVRGLLILMGSVAGWLVLYWLLFHVMGGAGKVRVPAYPLALPLIGMVVGLVELATGVPFAQVADAWQRLPRWLQVPLGFVIGIGLVVAIVTGFYYVLLRAGVH